MISASPRSYSLAAWALLSLCTLAIACVSKPAPVAVESIEHSPHSWLGQRKPDQSFDLVDGQ